jgi:hypothetical protein
VPGGGRQARFFFHRADGCLLTEEMCMRQ